MIENYAKQSLVPRDEYFTNFLGPIVKPSYFDTILRGKEGFVESVPIIGNWHACVAEWGACLRALDLAQAPFMVMELGCGWRCWLNKMAVAARNKDFDYRLISIEGDPDHINFAKETLRGNGISSEKLELHHGIAAATNRIALFPNQKPKSSSWGLELFFLFLNNNVKKRFLRDNTTHCRWFHYKCYWGTYHYRPSTHRYSRRFPRKLFKYSFRKSGVRICWYPFEKK